MMHTKCLHAILLARKFRHIPRLPEKSPHEDATLASREQTCLLPRTEPCRREDRPLFSRQLFPVVSRVGQMILKVSRKSLIYNRLRFCLMSLLQAVLLVPCWVRIFVPSIVFVVLVASFGMWKKVYMQRAFSISPSVNVQLHVLGERKPNP